MIQQQQQRFLQDVISWMMITFSNDDHHEYRYLEDEDSSSPSRYHTSSYRDDDTYSNKYISCSKEIHDEILNFSYIAISIVWYVLLVSIIHKCCLKVQLDGAPIYDTQYWCITGTIQFVLIIISILLFFPYPCYKEETMTLSIVDPDCLSHCQQDRYICMSISGIETIIGIYWYYKAYVTYNRAKRISSTTMSSSTRDNMKNGCGSGTNTDGSSSTTNPTFNNGIFTKLPNMDHDDDDMDDDDDLEDGLEMTENSEDTWE